RLSLAFLDGFQGFGAEEARVFVFFVELEDPRIKVPAVVVEPHSGVTNKILDLPELFLLKMDEPDDNVSHLDARVVDVILNFDSVSSKSEQPRESIAQNGVAQVPNVRCLVGIDAGMLNENFPLAAGRRFRRRRSQVIGGLGKRGPLQMKIQVSGPRNGYSFDPVHREHPRGNLFSNSARRLAEVLGQLKARRHRNVAHPEAGWGVENREVNFATIEFENYFAEPLLNALLDFEIQNTLPRFVREVCASTQPES